MIDQRLVAPGSFHRFACARTVLAVTIALRLATRRWDVLADQPPELFRPVPLVSWLSHPPGAGVLVAVQVVGIAGALVAATGRRARPGFAVAWLALLFLAGLRTSAGKILHNDVLLLLAAVPILFGPARARLGDVRRSASAGWPVRASIAVVGCVYLLTGLQKLRHSGLAWVASDNFRWVLYGGAASGRAPIRDAALFIADRPWLAHLTAAGLLGFELAAPWLLAGRRTRTAVVAIAVVLHGGTWLTLGLDYWAWILTVAAVALPWDRLVAGDEPAAKAAVELQTTGGRV